jgi:hypothetical protein
VNEPYFCTVVVAGPFDSPTGVLLTPDAVMAAGNQAQAGTYGNELLDAHYAAGDGCINENLGFTAVHELFCGEHDRLVAHANAPVRAELARGDTTFAPEPILPGADGVGSNIITQQDFLQA